MNSKMVLMRSNKKDYKEVIKFWVPLVKQGHASAQFNLGVMYFNGQGVPQNNKEATRLYRLSAD
jgi:uncharacterized protein